MKNVLLYGVQALALITKPANKLLAAETDIWKTTTRNSREGKFRNCIVRATVNEGKSMILVEVTDETQLQWFGHVKKMPKIDCYG